MRSINRRAPSDRFNPRPREGSDPAVEFWNGSRKVSIHAPVKGATTIRIQYGYTAEVSIHAPVKGATSSFSPLSSRSPCFNPRPREGSDVLGNSTPCSLVKFQSTPP